MCSKGIVLQKYIGQLELFEDESLNHNSYLVTYTYGNLLCSHYSILVPPFQAVPLVVSVMVFVVQFFAHPYKNNIANYSELLVNLMLVIILALGNTTVLISAVGSVKTFTLWPPFYLPVFCGGVVAVIWVIYKVW